MLAKTKAIILRNTNYRESSIISKMYTREFGIRSYILQSIRKSKKGLQPAVVMPLSIVDLDVYEKANTGIQRIKDVRPSLIFVNMHSDFVRQSVAMFAVEFLNHYLQSEFCESEVFDFLEKVIIGIEQRDSVANIPIELLLGLADHVGIAPSKNYSDASPYFDIKSSSYRHIQHEMSFNEEQSALLYAFQSGLHEEKGVNKGVRKEVLEGLILYFQVHLQQTRQMKSLDILSEILN